MNYLEDNLREIEDNHEGQIMAQRKAADRINKL